MRSRTTSTFVGFVATVIWSCAVVGFHRIADSFGPYLGMSAELFLDGLFLLSIAASRGKATEVFSHSKQTYIFAGGFWVTNMTMFALAIGLSRSGPELVVVGLINYLWPMLTIVCSIIVLKKAWNWGLLVAVILSLAGIVLCKTSGFSLLKNVGPPIFSKTYPMMLVGAWAWGFYSVFIKKYSNENLSTPIPIFMFFGSILGLILYLTLGSPVQPDFRDFLFLILWAIATSIAYLSWDVGMRFGNMVTVSASAMLIPLLST